MHNHTKHQLVSINFFLCRDPNIVDHIKHIQVSLVHANPIETIVGVGGVSTQQKRIMLKN